MPDPPEGALGVGALGALGDVPRWSAAELAQQLIAPDLGERLSPAGGNGPGAVVLDLTTLPTEEGAATILDALPILPCVTIALRAAKSEREGDASSAAIATACDVVVESEAALASLLAGFRNTPISAVAFVQLLRAAPRRTIYEGLLAESFVYSTLQAGREFAAWHAARQNAGKRGGRLERWLRGGEAAVQADERACRLERVESRLEITLTRPEKHNAFSRAMRDGLSEGLQLALADGSIEDVVLTGEGDSFCSGGDLDEFGSFPDPAEAHLIRTTRSPALLLSRLSERTRVSAFVHGACIGAGAELPAFLQRVVAREDAFFQLPEVGLGLVPGAGGTVSLPLRIGRQKTAWLGLSGARIDAQQALDWGLVDEVRLGQHPGS